MLAHRAARCKLTSPGRVLYHQQRVGQHGRIFTVHKFRSMRQDAEAETGPVWAAKHGDARVTRDRRIAAPDAARRAAAALERPRGRHELRRPASRAARVRRATLDQARSRIYGQRHIVRPGLTGWAQVRYTYGATTEDALQKLQYDLYYIKNLSIALDLFIILVHGQDRPAAERRVSTSELVRRLSGPCAMP